MSAAAPGCAARQRILGVDPGTHRTGYGWLQNVPGWGDVGFGVLAARGAVPDRLLAIERGITGILDKVRPDRLAIEEAFYGKDVRSLLRIGEVRGVILAAARRRGIEVEQYSPASVKLAVTGSGRATKEQVAAMVARLLPGLGARPHADAADALAVAICAAHRMHFTAETQRHGEKRVSPQRRQGAKKLF